MLSENKVSGPATHVSEGAVLEETEWRKLPSTLKGRSPQFPASRWRSFQNGNLSVAANGAPDTYLIAITLRNTVLSLHLDGKLIHSGIATPGTTQLTGPNAYSECKFTGPFDAIHLHVPVQALHKLLGDDKVEEWAIGVSGQGLVSDRTMEHLARTLVMADQNAPRIDTVFSDSVGKAILARLLSVFRADPGGDPSRAGLMKWRLVKVTNFVEANLSGTIRLEELSQLVGLSAVHFASQFKATTGLSPHDYVVRRRIERAQEMTLSDVSLAEIASAVGFKSQAHFTTTFSRLVGKTPNARRRQQKKAQPE